MTTEMTAYDPRFEQLVDREYLWALEVVACTLVDDAETPDPRSIGKAYKALEDANLNQPRDRPDLPPEE